MFGLGVTELLIIAAIVLLFFGAKRLPQIGEGLGKTIREFKKVSKDIKQEAKKEESPQKGEPEDPKQDLPSQMSSIKEELESIPGVDEIKAVKDKASQARKWWQALKH